MIKVYCLRKDAGAAETAQRLWAGAMMAQSRAVIKTTEIFRRFTYIMGRGAFAGAPLFFSRSVFVYYKG